MKRFAIPEGTRDLILGNVLRRNDCRVQSNRCLTAMAIRKS